MNKQTAQISTKKCEREKTKQIEDCLDELALHKFLKVEFQIQKWPNTQICNFLKWNMYCRRSFDSDEIVLADDFKTCFDELLCLSYYKGRGLYWLGLLKLFHKAVAFISHWKQSFFFFFSVGFWSSNPQEHGFPGIFALGKESELFWQMHVKCTAFQEHGFSLRNLTFLLEGILPSLYNLVESQGFCLSSVHHLNVQKVILILYLSEEILLKIVLSFRRMWICFPTVACCIVLHMQTWDQDLPHRVTFIIIVNVTVLFFLEGVYADIFGLFLLWIL